MHTHLLVEFLLAGVSAVLLSACGPSWLTVRSVPEDGFAQTLNYQFQAKVHADSLGHCRMFSVQVKPLNKMYSGGEPPHRLRLFDDDCTSPIRFERAQYVSASGPVRLSGSEVDRFLGSFVRLEDELMGWLWRAGVI